MKKTLLAAALLAGFATAGVAQAETSVTLYGVVDTGYGFSQFKYDHAVIPNTAINSRSKSSGLSDGFLQGNRWGLRGSEDLGDGLRAIFQLENGFSIGSGQATGQSDWANGGGDSSIGFNRQAFMGLSSDNWGTFTMGRQYNFADSYLDGNGSAFGDMESAFGAKSVRMDKMFKYETPEFSGFQAGIGYAANAKVERIYENNVRLDGTDRTNYLTAGLKYSNGPIYFAATYDRQGASGQGGWSFDPTTNAFSQAKYAVTNWAINGSYDFEVVKLDLGYGQDRHGKLNDILGAGTAEDLSDGWYGWEDYNIQGFKSHNYYVGLTAPLGGGSAALTWLRSSSNLDDVYNDRSGYKTQNIYAAKYAYPLSKRTKVYAYGAYATGVSYLEGMKATQAGVGLNHNF